MPSPNLIFITFNLIRLTRRRSGYVETRLRTAENYSVDILFILALRYPDLGKQMPTTLTYCDIWDLGSCYKKCEYSTSSSCFFFSGGYY